MRDNLYDAEAQMAQVAILLDNLTQVVVLLALVGINTGISMILNGSGTPGKPKKLDAAMRWITYGFSLVLAVLAIAAFAVDEREMFWENDDRFYMLDYNGAYGDDNVRTGNALSLAFDVIFFVMVLLLTAKAIMTLVPAKREPRVRKVSTVPRLPGVVKPSSPPFILIMDVLGCQICTCQQPPVGGEGWL